MAPGTRPEVDDCRSRMPAALLRFRNVLRMSRRLTCLSLSACAGALLLACGSGSPTQPSSVNGASAAAAGSASVTTPQPVQPADGARIADGSQPVSLVIRNATVTGSGATTYTFE